ncbi:MAG: YdeI/OmpD-associated family protein [Gemmatimonadota bacterium]
MVTPLRDRYPRYYPKTRKEWRRWLTKNHETSSGVWLVNYKKKSGKPRVPYADAVEEALCFGWIDSVMNPLDDDSFMQLFTPRKPKSNWSKLNKQRIEKLVEQGLMVPAGAVKIEAAKRDGTWTMLDAVEALNVPPDLARALARNKTALKNFEAFSPSRKKMLLYWVNEAKRPETRAKRIVEAAAAAKENRDRRPFAGEPKPKGVK